MLMKDWIIDMTNKSMKKKKGNLFIKVHKRTLNCVNQIWKTLKYDLCAAYCKKLPVDEAISRLSSRFLLKLNYLAMQDVLPF